MKITEEQLERYLGRNLNEIGGKLNRPVREKLESLKESSSRSNSEAPYQVI